MTIHVSVVICTRNRPDLIGQAVESVLNNTYSDFDLTVVDQSTDDRTERIVASLSGGDRSVRYIHNAMPGLSRAYNTGIRESSGSILAFTDDDCVAERGWIQSIVAAFEREPDVDLLYGQVQRARALVGVDGECPELVFDRTERLSHRDGFRIYGMGANFAARRRIFDRIGGFDEMLGGGGPLKSSQDFDFQYRVYRAGAVVLLCPAAVVEHYGLRTWQQWPATLRAYGFGDGAFYSKHVRCGDLFALSLLIRQLGRFTARETLSRIRVRPRPSYADYISSCLAGIWKSRGYPVNRRTRMYSAMRAG
jgi:glycosyltransferase involved in cell wall biosynthesis